MLKRSIASKILGTVIGITIIGFGLLIYWVIAEEEKRLLEERRRTSELMAEPILHTLYQDMLDARADMVRYLVKGMKTIEGAERVQVIRINGREEAFQDFKTLRSVEKYYGRLKPEWIEDHPDAKNNVAQGINNPRFQDALKRFLQGEKEGISYSEANGGGKRLFTYLVPIEFRQKCVACHVRESNEKIRGVLMLSTSLEGMYEILAQARIKWMLYGVLTIVGVAGLLTILIKNIIRPLQRISSAAGKIAEGDYSVAIPVNTNDEIGILSDSFNKMTREIEVRTKEIEEGKERYRVMLQTASDAIITADQNGRITGFNIAAEKIFDYALEEVLGKDIEILMPERHRPLHREGMQMVLTTGNALTYGKIRRLEGLRKDGSEFPIELALSVARLDDKLTFLAIIRDVTEREWAETELKKLSTAMEKSVNLVFITDFRGDIEYVNPMFEQVTGWLKEEVVGQNPRIISSGEMPKEEYGQLWDTILEGKTFTCVFKNKKKNGEIFWVNSTISPIKNERGEITHFLAIQEDITERKLSEERLQYLALYDGLTGLVNRRRFVELLDAWISYAKGASQNGALLLIDIDDFKSINDIYGHNVGDEFLRRVSHLFKDVVEDMNKSREAGEYESIIGRMGGNEFALFLPGADEKEGMDEAERIQKMFESYTFIPVNVHSTASIGVVLYPEHGIATKELLTRADAALYRAKELGHNRRHLYQTEDHDLEKVHSRLKAKERIQRAIEEDRFEPWFQPILDLKTDTIHHYEALARMRDESGTILLPGAFIDTAERLGLIGAIDRIITEKTMRLQAEMRRQGKDILFSMNLSGKNLGDEEFLQFLKARILETGAQPDHLIFEITETAAVQDMDKAINFTKALKSIGCHFSLDDFGVGFTSFVYLREIQIDFIKIDGFFIRNLLQNRNDQLFVKAITDVTRGMGIKAIAEFVEEKEMFNAVKEMGIKTIAESVDRGEIIRLLKKFGVDYAQGYAVGKPAPKLAGH